MNIKHISFVVTIVATLSVIGFGGSQMGKIYAQAPSVTGASTDDGSAGSSSSGNFFGGASNSASGSGKTVNCGGGSAGMAIGTPVVDLQFGSVLDDCNSNR
jgi:hypothetical protein